MLPIAAYALEIDFPEVGGIKPEPAFGPANWINYIFVFGLAIVGLAIIGSLVYAGFEWMSGAENSSKIQSAKDRILGSVIGLIILLGSYVFLNTINPQLVSLKNPKIMIKIEGKWKDFYKPSGDAGTRLVGEACSGGEECATGKCNSICLNKDSKPFGETCKLSSDCDSGYCDTISSKCSYSSSSTDGSGNCGNGKVCADGFRCLSNYIGYAIADPSDTTSSTVGTCTKKRAPKEACSPAGAYDTGCFKGTCIDNVCTTLLFDNSKCSKPEECASNNCAADGTCQPK